MPEVLIFCETSTGMKSRHVLTYYRSSGVPTDFQSSGFVVMSSTKEIVAQNKS